MLSEFYNVYSDHRVAINPLRPFEYDLLHTHKFEHLLHCTYEGLSLLAKICKTRFFTTHDLRHLQNHLEYVMMRAITQQRVLMCTHAGTNIPYIVFDTLLRSVNDEPIFAVCASEVNKEKPYTMQAESVVVESDLYACLKTLVIVAGVLQPASFPTARFFAHVPVVCTMQNHNHLVEHSDRVAMLSRTCPAFARLSPQKQTSYLVRCIQESVARARVDSTWAVFHMFYKSVYDEDLQCMRMRGQCQFLLPLYDPVTSKLLPVVACLHFLDNAYYVRTVLPLQNARKNIRLLHPHLPPDHWASPDHQ